MKKIIIALFAFAACSSQVFAIPHNLNEYGLTETLNSVYAKAEKPEKLAPVIKKYHDRASKKQFDISYEDLKLLHEELSKVIQKTSKRSI
jgi:hypothetical protein